MRLNKLNNRFYVNNVYRTKADAVAGGESHGNKLVVFLGYQDNKHFGFFRELNNPNTFFGLRLSEIIFTYETI